MKIIKANQLLAVPVNGLKPSHFVRLDMIPRGQIVAVHDETLNILPKDSFEVVKASSKKEKNKKK